MSTWKNLKKKLPYNYASVVAERLTNKGFAATSSYVSDVRRGKIKDLEIAQKVWTEIRALAAEHSQKTISLNKVKAS